MGNFAETRGGVGKSGVYWSTKAAISLKRVKIEEKLLWNGWPIGSHKRSFERYQHRRPTASSSRRLKVRNPQNFNHCYIKKTSNLAGTFTGFIGTKAYSKFWRKKERGRIQALPKFFGYRLLSQE